VPDRKTLELHPHPTEETPSGFVRRCSVSRIDNGKTSDRRQLWFEVASRCEPPAADDCDAYLLGVVMDAMRERRDIVVRGSVSKTLLSNLVEYQAAWRKWLPSDYGEVQMQPECIRDGETAREGALCAFSGGVDATFSVWRHTQRKFSHRSQDIKACALVNGFDIPLGRDIEYRNAFASAARTLGDVGLELIELRTNYKHVATTPWEHAFACALVAALSNFKRLAGTCVVGSSEPYDTLVIPWGSSPITDHLLASGDFSVIHDGADCDRTEKVAQIAGWTAGVDNLRVCWQGELNDRNCGTCEKCLRTKLNFLATGHHVPPSLPGGDPAADIRSVHLGNRAVRAEWEQIYRHARARAIRADWTHELGRLLGHEKGMRDYLLPPRSRPAELARRLVRRWRGAWVAADTKS